LRVTIMPVRSRLVVTRYTFPTMPTRLEEILAATRARVAKAKAGCPRLARASGALTSVPDELAAAAEQHHTRGFRDRLLQVSRGGPQSPAVGNCGIAVIAELKKASPSKGLIRADFDVPSLAAELAHAGAACLSVLTDEQFFQGSLHNLELASYATRIPCLRKDFILDEFQLVEARACRADAVLLIVAALTDDELVSLHRRARELQLDVLVEVHAAAELDRALAAGCDLIGVNNRNLHTFEVNLATSLELVKRIPANVVKVAESGIDSAADIARLRDAGFDAFLIGESLMRAASPGAALRALLA
jgi:indole-3-glycerol phosphate synthase